MEAGLPPLHLEQVADQQPHAGQGKNWAATDVENRPHCQLLNYIALAAPRNEEWLIRRASHQQYRGVEIERLGFERSGLGRDRATGRQHGFDRSPPLEIGCGRTQKSLLSLSSVTSQAVSRVFESGIFGRQFFF